MEDRYSRSERVTTCFTTTCVLKFARCSGGRSQSGRKGKKEEKKDVRSESCWNGSENRTIGTRVS